MSCLRCAEMSFTRCTKTAAKRFDAHWEQGNYSSPGLKTVKIPAATWMCFKLSGADDDKVNEFYKNILWRFMQASSCKRDESFPEYRNISRSDMA